MELRNGLRELIALAERQRLAIGDFAHLRRGRAWAIAIWTVLREPKCRIENPYFPGKTARIQKKEGFIRTPPNGPNRHGPSSSLSNLDGRSRAIVITEPLARVMIIPPRFKSLAFIGGHISAKYAEIGPRRPCVRCVAI